MKIWKTLTSIETKKPGTPLEVQWLRLTAFTAEGPGSIPGWGTKIPKLCSTARKKKEKRKASCRCPWPHCTRSAVWDCPGPGRGCSHVGGASRPHQGSSLEAYGERGVRGGKLYPWGQRFLLDPWDLKPTLFLVAQTVKNLPTMPENLGLVPGLGRSPGEGNGNSLHYSRLENPTDRGAWWATVHGVAKSRIRLSTSTPFLPRAQGAGAGGAG